MKLPARLLPQWATLSASRKPSRCSSHTSPWIGTWRRKNVPGRVPLKPPPARALEAVSNRSNRFILALRPRARLGHHGRPSALEQLDGILRFVAVVLAKLV